MKFKEAQALRIPKCSPIYTSSLGIVFSVSEPPFLGSYPLPRGSLKSVTGYCENILTDPMTKCQTSLWVILAFIASSGNAKNLYDINAIYFLSLLHHTFSHFSLRAHSSKLTVPKSLPWSLHSGKLHLFPLVHKL